MGVDKSVEIVIRQYMKENWKAKHRKTSHIPCRLKLLHFINIQIKPTEALDFTLGEGEVEILKSTAIYNKCKLNIHYSIGYTEKIDKHVNLLKQCRSIQIQ